MNKEKTKQIEMEENKVYVFYLNQFYHLFYFLENWRSKGHKLLRRKEGKQFSTRLIWESEEQNIKFSLNCRKISKKCNRKNRWGRMRDQEMKKVYRDRKRWREILWSTSIKWKPQLSSRDLLRNWGPKGTCKEKITLSRHNWCKRAKRKGEKLKSKILWPLSIW